MSVRREVRLWAAQRLTAAILGVCVLVHLATIVYAVRGGLSGAEILARTRGNPGFAAFYAVFAVSAAVHAAIGLRTVAAEWLGWRGEYAEFAVTVAGLVLTIAGLRAVVAVFGA